MKFFPVMARMGQRGGLIPWPMMEPHERQAQRNHGGQTLARLAERGGLDWTEASAVLRDRDWTAGDPMAACEQVTCLIIEWARETQREATATALAEAETLRAQLTTARAEARKAALEEAASLVLDLDINKTDDLISAHFAAAVLRALAQGEKP